jgi:hypothetical protein
MSGPQNTLSVNTRIFVAGMNRDTNDHFNPENSWVSAINATLITHQGDRGAIGNEPSTKLQLYFPLPPVSFIYRSEGVWVYFGAVEFGDCEIGLFDEHQGVYTSLVVDRRLGFDPRYPITGVCKGNADGTTSVYFCDGLNPDRVLNLDNIPFTRAKKKTLRNQQDCDAPQYTDKLDLDALLLHRKISLPKLKLQQSPAGGNLPNGSYQVVGAYAINGVRVTDYTLPSVIQPLFDHANMVGGLELSIEQVDLNFDEMELVLITFVNQQARAYKLGIYSTRQEKIYIDQINERLPAVDISRIPIRTVVYPRSNRMFSVSDYLIRSGVHMRPEINYQPQANEIQSRWVLVKVPKDYYSKGGSLTGYMRDENYLPFIRFVYETGERSADFPIFGRSPIAQDLVVSGSADAFENRLNESGEVLRRWQVENTATVTSTQTYEIEEGIVVLEGEMGYHETKTLLPDDKPEIYGKLCGAPVRLHKMPDVDLAPLISSDGNHIQLLAWKFENIHYPLDRNRNPVPGVVGYEIVRASRNGQATILAKGMLNHTGVYKPDNGIDGSKGLYPNFPLNDLRPNAYLSAQEVKGGCQAKGFAPLDEFSSSLLTFHSPDTQFTHPFLNVSELKISAELQGTSRGYFEPVQGHPKQKLLRDFALLIGGMVGAGTGLVAIRGKKITRRVGPKGINLGQVGTTTTAAASAGAASVSSYYVGSALKGIFGTVDSITGGAINSAMDAVQNIFNPSYLTSTAPGVIGGGTDVDQEESAVGALPAPLRILGGTFLFSYFFAKGTEEAIRIIRNLIPAQDFAWQYNCHGHYHTFAPARAGFKRRKIQDSVYLEPQVQDFAGYRVNNLYRSRSVILSLEQEVGNPLLQDQSRTTIGEQGQWSNPKKPVTANTSAFYGSLKRTLLNQYGTPESCVLQPVSIGPTPIGVGKPVVSPVLFGGDVYINRYTEKNSFCLFNRWLDKNFPASTEFNYRDYYNVAFPRFWMDSTEYDFNRLSSSLIRLNFKTDVLPNDFAQLDRRKSDCNSKISFGIQDAYMYLFVNGVRDFWVESTINVAHRDWEDTPAKRHYDPARYSNLSELFAEPVIKSGNHFKYDFSLSLNRHYNAFVSWGGMLPRSFNRTLVDKQASFPKRLIYSLPQPEEFIKDQWRVFLANNYKDFDSEVVKVQPTGQRGAMIFMKAHAPLVFAGIEQLSTDNGTKITIGDGELFAQTDSPISNADDVYAYGACQDGRSVINTPLGLFWVSARSGKIFRFTGNAEPIVKKGMQQWFNQHLPFKLLQDFPQFSYTDNPVAGIGIQSVYDPQYEIVYFSKRDYRVRPEYKKRISFKDGQFVLDDRAKILLTNDLYFEDASFTVSFAADADMWVSYHDWHPSLVLAGDQHFTTIAKNAAWKHNVRYDSFCNFYNDDFPFEVEYVINNAQTVSVLKSLEYHMECFRYYGDGSEQHHVLDHNFDRAQIYNSEQHSGLLKLYNRVKRDPFSLLDRPAINIHAVDTTYSKEENKYRINQFFDLVRTRSEFNSKYIPLWETEANGYRKIVNPEAIEYSKSALERKRFRHKNTRVVLTRLNSGSVKMLLAIVNAKQSVSFR